MNEEEFDKFFAELMMQRALHRKDFEEWYLHNKASEAIKTYCELWWLIDNYLRPV